MALPWRRVDARLRGRWLAEGAAGTLCWPGSGPASAALAPSVVAGVTVRM